MATAEYFYLPFRPAIGPNGLIASGAKFYFYATETNVFQTIYADADLTIPLGNPVVANLAGVYPNVYLDGSLDYHLVIKDADDNELYEIDPYIPGVAGETGPEGPPGSVNAASKLTITTIQPATPSTGTSQELVEFTTPTNPAGQPAPSKIRFSATHSPYAANSQGFTHPAYTNKTAGFTINATATYGKEVTSDANSAMIMEHGFITTSARPGGGWVKGVEFHWQIVGADFEGYRPITAYAPWTGADMRYDSQLSIRAANMTHLDGEGNIVIQYVFRGGSGDPKSINLGPTVSFAHSGNGTPWLKQLNAAGNAFLNLPFINIRDHIEENAASEGNVSTWSTNGLGIYSAWARSCSSAPNNARLHYLGAAGGSLATVTMYEADATASTEAINMLRNNHASGAVKQVIEAYGTGNASIQLGRGFVYANLTWNGVTVTFDKPLRQTPVALADLPSAATAGAGTRAFVNNATATTFASVVTGGGSNVVPVYSDGTNWRIG